MDVLKLGQIVTVRTVDILTAAFVVNVQSLKDLPYPRRRDRA